MTRNIEDQDEPLTPEEVGLIDQIEPPEHRSDFWARLDEARMAPDFAHDAADDEPLDDPIPLRPERQAAIFDVEEREESSVAERGYRKLALVAAAVSVVVAAAVVYQLVNTEQSSTDVATVSEPVQTVAPTPTVADVEVVPQTTLAESTEPSATVVEAPQPSTATETPEPPSLSVAGPPAPQNIQLNASEMTQVGSGNVEGIGYRMFGNGSVEENLELDGGTYRIEVRAVGYAKGGDFRPQMELRVDGQAVGSEFVELGGAQTYTFDVSIAAGQRSIAAAFVNDPNRPELDVDLEIGNIAVRALG